MKKVFKYPVVFGDYFNLNLPKDAEILTVKQIYDEWFLWALVEDDAVEFEKRNFRICGTGHHFVEKYYKWITTETQEIGGTIFIWHIFEILKG